MKSLRMLFALPLFVASLCANAQITRVWEANYNGQGDYNDRFTCSTKDAAGNLYLGGSSVNPGVDRDFLITKMNPSGAVLWTRMFDGPGNGPDEVTAITTDATGNVYATGLSKGDNTSEDYWTAKLKTNGDSLWTRRYDFIGEYDQPNAIFVDAAGNVYVTGQSDQDPSAVLQDDYATVKYDASGTLKWVKRYDGLGGALDRAVKVLADAAGNVTVTGRSDNGDNDDYVTIRYNAAGVQQWIRYDDRSGRDRAVDMLADATGNLVVTGRSNNGDNDDFWTLKISPTGSLIWDVAYDFVENDRPLALTSDDQGRIFITGQSDGTFGPLTDWDYLTVAYDANGDKLWDKRYDGAGASDDLALAVAADGTGHVFVTGMSNDNPNNPGSNAIVTIGYDAVNGNSLFTKTYFISDLDDNIGYSLTGLASGGCVMVGYGEYATRNRDAVAIRYNVDGTQNWLYDFDGTGDNNENIRDLAIGLDQSISVAGYVAEAGNNRNFALVRFDDAGQTACAYTVEGSATGSEDDAVAIALDDAGNAVVAGVTKNDGTSNDLTLFKLGVACDTVWTRIWDGGANGSDRIYDMARSSDGSIYNTGRIDTDPSPAAEDDCFLAKVDNAGNQLWLKSYNSGFGNSDRGVLVKVSNSQDIYVAGRSLIGGVQHDLFLIKYNSQGVQQWVKTYGAGANIDAEPHDMALDAEGNVLICGIIRTLPDTNYNFITLKYSAAGTLVFEQAWGGAEDDQAVAIATDPGGNVVVTGSSDQQPGPASNTDIIVLRYTPDGTLIWSQNLQGNSAADDTPDDIATNAAWSIYLTGHINNGTAAAPNYDIVTAIYDLYGQQQWSDVYNGASDSSDVPNLIYLNGTDFYVAGSTWVTGEQRNMIILKYSGAVATQNPQDWSATTVSPNPFQQQLTVQQGQIGSTFELMDMLGRPIVRKTLTDTVLTLQLPSLPAGLYAYRIITASAVLTSGVLQHAN
jgi:uncharacterized delta-60 repeat protein